MNRPAVTPTSQLVPATDLARQLRQECEQLAGMEARARKAGLREEAGRLQDIATLMSHLACDLECKAADTFAACRRGEHPEQQALRCSACGTEYQREAGSGIRLCRKCGAPVDANPQSQED